MFFKMLKHDLKVKKGLNVILFLFMTVASILVFVGTVQVYANLTGDSRTRRLCKSAGLVLMYEVGSGERQEKEAAIRDYLDEYDGVERLGEWELTEIESRYVDFAGYDEKTDNLFLQYNYFLAALPRERNLVYDLEDKPFYVKNGTVAVPVVLKDYVGAEVGDKLRFSTEMGNVYELEIACFFKEPLDSSSVRRFIVSDADYKLLSEEFTTRITAFDLVLAVNDDYHASHLAEDLHKDMGLWPAARSFQGEGFSENAVMMFIISTFIIAISIVMILIICMTIRFTMIAALKEEEREIGMMRAIGVDSLSFRWLFAAKYIAFAILGGGIAGIVGLPISRLMLLMFSNNLLFPEPVYMLLLGIFATALIVAVMIGFSLSVMRRIQKISVVDALHGENRGERFESSSVLLLHKRKKMSIPFYLALSDILKSMKRYLFLITAYTLGILIMLTIYNLRHTVISSEFLKYVQVVYETDYFLVFTPENLKEMVPRLKESGLSIWELVNQELKEEGIPAYVDLANTCEGKLMLTEEAGIPYQIYYGSDGLANIRIRKGGRVPELANEVMLSYYAADLYGVQVGDVIRLAVEKYSEDKTHTEEVTEEFVVTAFFDNMDSSVAILGREYEGTDIKTESKFAIAFIIDAEEDAYEKAFQKLKEFYGEGVVVDGEEYARQMLREYDDIFRLLEYVMVGAAIFITVLMTYLYSNIFLSEETPEIALLKSMGCSDGVIKAWQLLRFLILVLVSVLLAVVLYKTVLTLAVQKLFELLEITGFTFLPEYLVSFVQIPAAALEFVLLTEILNLKNVKKIAIWKVREE